MEKKRWVKKVCGRGLWLSGLEGLNGTVCVAEMRDRVTMGVIDIV